MAAHEHGPIRVLASYVCCLTDGHAMSFNDRSACRADPPAPAPAVAMLQCPRKGHTDDGRCKVVQSSKRVGPDVQHFAPILAIEMDSTSNMEKMSFSATGADVLDTLSLRDHLITDFLLSTVIL